MRVTARPGFHPTYAKVLHALMLREGFDASAALAQAGLVPDRLDDGARMVEAEQFRDFILQALSLTRCPFLGLEFGLAAQVFMHGPVGYAATSSATLGQALTVVARYVGMRSTAFRIDLREHPDATELLVVELVDMGGARSVMLEAVFIMLARLLQSLGGHSCADVRYSLPWPQPAWSTRYADYVAGTCAFGADRLSFQVPAALMAAPCIADDPRRFAAACDDCERSLAHTAPPHPVAEQVRARLLRFAGDYPTLDMLAAELACSPRTLMRRLKAEGSCYQDLLDEVRYERARWYLQHTRASMETIAEHLGLQDTSNFSRSFRRWSGITPSQFRLASPAAQP